MFPGALRVGRRPTRTCVRVPSFGAVWARSGRILALREPRNVTLGTARCDLPAPFSAAERHLGVAPCPHSTFPVANRDCPTYGCRQLSHFARCFAGEVAPAPLASCLRQAPQGNDAPLCIPANLGFSGSVAALRASLGPPSKASPKAMVLFSDAVWGWVGGGFLFGGGVWVCFFWF